MDKDYILTKIKLNNFYGIYNTKDVENNKIIKDLFDYKKIKNKEFIFNDYTSTLYKELINILYDCLTLQLKTIYKFIYKKDENKLETLYKELPKEVINVIEKNNIDNINLGNVINITDKLGPIMYYLSNYCDRLQVILEMFFETEKYENMCEKYLQCEEGKDEKELLELVKKQFKNI